MGNKKTGKKITKPIKPNGYGVAEREFINKHPINQEDLKVYLKNGVDTDFSYLLNKSY